MVGYISLRGLNLNNLDVLYINNFTTPIHLFLEGRDISICGMGAYETNNLAPLLEDMIR